MDTNLDPKLTEENRGLPVYIIQPKDASGEPMELYFAVTETGLLIHMQQMDDTLTKEEVNDEMAKLLFGMESVEGRYTEFIKNPDHYVIKMKVVSDFSPEDAKKINELYYMSSEDRRRKLAKDKSAWLE